MANWLKGLGYRIADHFVSGDNYNPQTGQWNATPGQYVSGIGSGLLNLLAPGLGTLAGKGFDRYYNSHPNMGGPTQSQIPLNSSISVNDLGWGNLGLGGMPSYNPSFNPLTTPTTGANPYDQFNPSSGNIFDPTGTFSGNPGYSGGASSYTGNGGMGWAQNAGGGASQGGGIGSGWTGISGDAARGMFSGMASASDDAVQAEAAAQMRRMRQ